MSSLDDLKAFEADLDRTVEQLPIVQLPSRVFLSCYFAAVDAAMRGARFGKAPPNLEIGMALAGRLSYLAPILAKFKHDEQPNAKDVVEFVDDGIMDQAWLLMSYAHYSELMPEVHRSRWRVERDVDTFVLHHPDASFKVAEARDVVLAELALQFMVPPPPNHQPAFDKMVAREQLDPVACAMLVDTYARYFIHAAFEEAALSADALKVALGVSKDEFHRFRAVWFAIAEFCLGMADAVERRAQQEGAQSDPKFVGELNEWTGPMLSQAFLDGLALGISRLSPESYDALMKIFSLDPSAGLQNAAGDGFIPPLLRMGSYYLFSPHMVRVLMASRNVLYVVNKRDRTRFDALVSSSLEPTLVHDAAELFRKIDGVLVAPNVSWKGSEIDLLVFDPKANAVLHIQAKAPIPVEGARMVRSLEDHVRKGFEQLAQFRALPSTERDRIVSQAVGAEVRDVCVIDVLLSRTCLGTQRVWKDAVGIAVVNIPLLREVLQRMNERGDRLDRFEEVARETLDAIVADVVLEWRDGTIELGKHSVRVPLLQIDQWKMNRYRARLLPKW